MFFFKNHGENEAKRIVPNLFLFFKIALYKVKASSATLFFSYFGRTSLGHTIKTNCMTFLTVDSEKCSILIVL